MSESIEVRQLCAAVTEAMSDVRSTFTARTEVADVLDRFWRLQDQLSLLVEAVSDRPEEARELLKEGHSIPIQSIVDILGFTSKLKIGKLAAVAESCSKINDALWKLEALLGESRTLVATA